MAMAINLYVWKKYEIFIGWASHTLIIYILNSFLERERAFSKIEGKCDPIPKNISYKIIN